MNPVEYITEDTERFSSEASICAARLSLILLMNLMAERPVSDFIFLYNVGLDSPISSHNSSTPNSVSGICSSMTDIRFFRNRSSEVVPEMADGSTVEFAGKYSAADNARSVNAVASAAFNDRTLTKNETHPHKMGKDFGITGFEALSFSPYNKTELAILKKLITE